MIGFSPRYEQGGPASFQQRLAAGLVQRGCQVTYDLSDPNLGAVLVIGATRQLNRLFSLRRRGVRIVQRLNGMNWIHRQRGTGWRHFLRAEYGNWLLAAVRRFFAAQIVYQSHFSQTWWERVYGRLNKPSGVIYNGVDLAEFHPQGEGLPPADRWRLLVVEGRLGGGYESGLETAVSLAERLAEKLTRPLELLVAGQVSDGLQTTWRRRAQISLNFAGSLPRDQIPTLDRSAHLLYAADINAACPNSVVEALACGLPVLAFDTGALAELVPPTAGRIVTYGGDPWLLEPPDMDALVQAGVDLLADLPRFRYGARQRAEAALGLDAMVDGYLAALQPS